MKINVLFFGILSDITGKSKLTFDNIPNTEELLLHLESEYTALKNIKYLISVNKKLVNSNLMFKDGDEIALMPPFAGG